MTKSEARASEHWPGLMTGLEGPMLDSTEAMHDVAMAQAMVAAWSAELLLPADLGGVVVDTAGTCEVLITAAGFYARCARCQQSSGEIVHARFRARQWADGHACGTGAGR